MPPKYNLRSLKSRATWVKDETLKPEPESDTSSEDEDYEPDVEEDEDEDQEESEEEEPVIRLPKGSKVSVRLHIHTIANGKAQIHVGESEDEEESESESEEDDFIKHLEKKYGGSGSRRQARREEKETAAIELNSDEEGYFEDLPKSKRRRLNEHMKRLSSLIEEGDVPFKFRVLEMAIPDPLKATVIKKIDILNEMDGSEGYKLRTWVESFLRIPFGKCVPLPVTIADGPEKCSAFLEESTKTLDTAVYGMVSAKTQIMQILAQWMSNPSSVGNVIALKGPMGVGKTSFARNGVAKVLQRPFEFFSLGGASDASNFVGHSYTYEGSTWGRIADAVMSARCMNPVLYFDEVDKISTTAHGDEIASMLIHLTDRSQNSQFHDRYFAGVDFDLSQCLFVFSFNDESKIHPVLKDRMQVITCSGYSWEEKASIVRQYIWPQILDRIQLKDQLTISEEAVKYLISEFSKDEEGVRNLIRIVETLVTRVNLLRIAGETTAKKYTFYTPIKLPLLITPDLCRRILEDTLRSGNESFRHMYT